MRPLSPVPSLPVRTTDHFLFPLGGKYTKEDFKAYEKDVEKRSKLALKDHVKPQQEYPSAAMLILLRYFHQSSVSFGRSNKTEVFVSRS